MKDKIKQPTHQQIFEFWQALGLPLEPWMTWMNTRFLIDLNNLFEYAVPKSKMDALWIINNLDSPTPKIEYCFGFTRGESNDAICWNKTLPIEDCLSPIYQDPALAVFWAIWEMIKQEIKDDTPK